ncbi:MAG: hypothetical protein IKL10_08050, partial [Clostridia bacterium]|nr:hypothetical protein [Clostridia bacterium]
FQLMDGVFYIFCGFLKLLYSAFCVDQGGTCGVIVDRCPCKAEYFRQPLEVADQFFELIE